MRMPSSSALRVVREFAQSTAFTIYIEARDAPPTFQSISDAVGEGHFRSSRSSSRLQLASMYAGLGAKIVTFPVQANISFPRVPPAWQDVLAINLIYVNWLLRVQPERLATH
ncbi:hypothetical protein F53441_3973 [Fusarium austroafricanum]|uniref:Uncharacterized protein n=1 Tax=Fusarium austroafricanum TaxID=2364996 RepID=A0A8H4NZC6_9HYPO|nr:hypothetical protein F53441_3973 [Fusarium austroafricanum]